MDGRVNIEGGPAMDTDRGDARDTAGSAYYPSEAPIGPCPDPKIVEPL